MNILEKASSTMGVSVDEAKEILTKDLRKKKASNDILLLMESLDLSEEEVRDALKEAITGKKIIHLPDEAERNLIGASLTKLVRIMNDVYVLKTGNVISLDINYPYMVKLDSKVIDALWYLFDEEDYGSMIHIPNVREFKKYLVPSKTDLENGIDLEEYKKKVSKVRLNSERSNVLARTQYYYDLNGLCHEWHPLGFDEATINDIFVENNYFEFTPEGIEDGPSIILTKEAFPLITEKNVGIVEYSARQYSNELYLIVFRCDLGIFTSESFNFYINMTKKDSGN